MCVGDCDGMDRGREIDKERERERERDDASGQSLFDMAKKYRQANRGNSYLIFFSLKKKNWVCLLLFAWLRLINKEFSFTFLCGNLYFKTIYWSQADTYFMSLKC